jgi:hypothetical protein
MSVWVQVGIPENGHVLLELTNLCQVAHESLGDLLNKEGLIGHIEQDLFSLLSIGTL